MKKRGLSRFALPLVVLALAAAAMIPLSASAVSSSATGYHRHRSHHQPHFFLKPGHLISNAGSNLQYNGGPVMTGTTNVYAIFWEPTGNVSSTYHSLIERYFTDVGGTGLYKNNTQYTDSSGNAPSNTTLAGSWVDSTAYPESPLLDSDIQNEVSRAQSANGWTDSSGQEIGDKCAWTFGSLNTDGSNANWNGHPYLVQEEWDNAQSGCVLSGP